MSSPVMSRSPIMDSPIMDSPIKASIHAIRVTVHHGLITRAGAQDGQRNNKRDPLHRSTSVIHSSTPISKPPHGSPRTSWGGPLGGSVSLRTLSKTRTRF